jgi:hypothetical protein
MEKEYAAQQSRNGEGVLTYSAGGVTRKLKEVPTLDLQGEYITLTDLSRALLELNSFLRKVNPHPPERSAAVIQTKSVFNLVAQISRVAGRQTLLDFGETLESIAVEEARRGRQAIQDATKIAAEIRKDQQTFIEDFDARLATSTSPSLTLDALLAIEAKAPQLYSAGGALPPLDGDKLPRTLPSNQNHKLKVIVQGGVDAISGEVVVGVMNTSAIHGSLRNRLGTQGLVKIKVADNHQQRYFAAAQCADTEIDVTVSAVIPLHPDQRRGRLSLHLISIDGAYSYSDLLRLALSQAELDFNG